MDDRTFLAFETGGTKLVAAVADMRGTLIESRLIPRSPTNRAPHSLALLIDAAARLQHDYALRGFAFGGIGFGYGGQVSRSQQRVLRCPHEDGWEDIDVRAHLQHAFHLPCIIENDCKLAALAEAALGAGRGQRTVFYITIGTGIGGGIVRAERIVDFGDSGEGEVGHIIVMQPGGLACPCGNTGCLEAVASGPGLVALARKLAQEGSGDWQNNTTPQRMLHDETFSARDLFALYEQGEPFAGTVLSRAAAYTGQALACVIQLINPNVIVFGGGVGTASTRYLKLIEDMTRPQVMPSLRGRCAFVPSQLRENVVTQGAALMAAQTFA